MLKNKNTGQKNCYIFKEFATAMVLGPLLFRSLLQFWRFWKNCIGLYREISRPAVRTTDKFPWGTLRHLINFWTNFFLNLGCKTKTFLERSNWFALQFKVSNLICKLALLVVENIPDMLRFTEDTFLTTASYIFGFYAAISEIDLGWSDTLAT